jgi:hypothetical protein
MVAYEGLKQRRKDDYDTPADQIALSNEKNLANLASRLSQATPKELLTGAEPGYREFNYRTAALQEEAENIDQSLAYLSDKLKTRYGENFLEEAQLSLDEEKVAEYTNDPDYQEAVKLIGLYNKNAQRLERTPQRR